MHLDNDYYAGELHEEEYWESRIPEGMLWPEGGRVAEPRIDGPGIRRPRTIAVSRLSTMSMPRGPGAGGGQRRVHGVRRARRVRPRMN